MCKKVIRPLHTDFLERLPKNEINFFFNALASLIQGLFCGPVQREHSSIDYKPCSTLSQGEGMVV